MDSFEFNKIAGVVLGTLLFAMGLGLVAEGLFHAPSPAQPGYEIAVAEDTGGAAEADAGPAAIEPVSPLLASADLAAGETSARKCVACHDISSANTNKVGPGLWDIVNRKPGSHEGFRYSGAMTAYGEEHTWDYETLNHFLAGPRAEVPGTIMSFVGIRTIEERAALIAYLHTLSDSPAPLPEAGAAPADGAAPAEGEAPAAGEAPAEGGAAPATP
ncbi:c-type cytochrome [Methylobrevis albus]|uniref:Cytochrome c family protein n=1 Tax=Methylobrevis albus TaxID=2793297 RepID=A0A931MXN8_9HYPH|nr:cytochrome c family protein [Methylobrevis albus]MBH0237427.1 cytochrome c family protein [Methylobrevis albus]